jgi:Resolvase, N terminal domain
MRRCGGNQALQCLQPIDVSFHRSRNAERFAPSTTITATNLRGQDPEVQLRDLREYIEHRGWRLTEAYTDAGVSGAKDSRAELNRLMIDAGRRRFDVVIVWRFDYRLLSVAFLGGTTARQPTESERKPPSAICRRSPSLGLDSNPRSSWRGFLAVDATSRVAGALTRVRNHGMQAGKTVEATLPANLNWTVLDRTRRVSAGRQTGRMGDAIFANDALSQLSYSPTCGELRRDSVILSVFFRRAKRSASEALTQGSRPGLSRAENAFPGRADHPFLRSW